MIRLFLRWLNKNDAVTAIEFSLIAAPFMLIVVGIIELSLFFAASSLFNVAVNDAARLLRTGQIQQMSGSEDDQRTAFLDAVCKDAGYLIDCNNLQYQLIKLDSFEEPPPPKVDKYGNLLDPKEFDIDQVTSSCIAVVRISYLYSFFTPFFAQLWGNYPGGKRLIMATTTFEVEPYTLSSGCSST